MVDYKIVKHCRSCKKRYVVERTEAKKNYCDECQVKYNDWQKSKPKEKDEEKK